MREIRTSGLTRGSNGTGQKPPVALYSTGWFVGKLFGGKSQMPLADVGGGVALVLQDFRKSRFPLQQMGSLAGIMDPTVNPRADIVTPGEHGRAGWRAYRRACIEYGEAGSVGSKAVDVRGFNRAVIAADVAETEVVGEKHDDVRALGCDRRVEKENEGKSGDLQHGGWSY